MKQKTRKSVVKRFKISGTGKVLRRVSFGRHIRNSKSASQLRRYKKIKVVSGRTGRMVKRLLAKA